MSYTDIRNAVSRFQPRYNEDKTKQYFISRNFDNAKTTSAMFAFPIIISDWWRMQNNFNVSDVFKTAVFRSTANVLELNIYTRWELDFEPRVARLTFMHNFGGTKVKSLRKRVTASEQERQRISN